MRIPREAELLKPLEFRSDAAKLIHFPRGCSIVVNKSEQGLFFPALMAVECPSESPLCAHHEAQICVHAAAAWCPIEASTSCRKFVKPDWSIKRSLGHQRTERATDRVGGVKTFCAKRHI